MTQLRVEAAIPTMQRIRAIIRKLLAQLLYLTGVLWLGVLVSHRRRAVVLTYHRVLPRDADSFSSAGIVVTPATFAAHMRFLSQHFHLLTIDEFHECLTRGQFPPRSVLVTFDDGWRDLERHALPVLRHCRVPFAVFVPTAFIGTNETFWQERMTRALVILRRAPAVSKSLLADLGISGLLEGNDDRARVVARRYVSELKQRPMDEIESIDVKVRAALHEAGMTLNVGDDTFLTWPVLRDMAADPLVAVGSHGHSHVPLTRLNANMAAADLFRAVEEFRANGLSRPRACAYPNGECNDAVMTAASDAGCLVGFTTESGHVRPGDEPLRLKRLNVHDGVTASVPEFLCRMLALH